MTDDINTLLKRMEKLERGNRWLKVVVTLVLCVILAAFYVGAVKWNKEIVTETLKIVDEKGNIQALLSGSPEGPDLSFYDSGEKVRMSLGLVRGDSGIRFSDPDGKTRIIMALVGGGPMITFADPNGKVRMAMSTLNEKPGIHFFDTDGKERMNLSLKEKGVPNMDFLDPNGKMRMIMTLVKGEPGLLFIDSKGNLIHQLP
ncbi:MAG: hypothetical protein NTX88_00565 [Candidatus Atribacteria bacterium]|nr:hypothetical protein [Candidatus Atribacteria bacterium]